MKSTIDDDDIDRDFVTETSHLWTIICENLFAVIARDNEKRMKWNTLPWDIQIAVELRWQEWWKSSYMY